MRKRDQQESTKGEGLSDYDRACQRYKEHRKHTRALLEEAAFHHFRMRVDVSSVDEDILRRAQRDWYGQETRRVAWDWEAGIMQPHNAAGVRGLDFAILVRGQLCGLMAARLSPAKKWLSLTHVEGSPVENPLKGMILALSMQGMIIFRSQFRNEGEHKKTGIRVINPLECVVPYYASQGYTDFRNTKWLRQIVIEWPAGEENETATINNAGCVQKAQLCAQLDQQAG